MRGAFYRPSALEVAWGWVPGREQEQSRSSQRVGSTAWRASPAEARRALEASIRPALARPPCLVSFSGGRDSSVVLAVATDLARREGLPLPVPVTQLFPAVEEAREDRWQEAVIGHLRLSDWERQRFEDDELDLLGPFSAEGLRRHGVIWPPLAYGQIPMLEAARGGSLLSGEGGDEVLGGRRSAPLAVLFRGRRHLDRRLAGAAAASLAPGPLRLAEARRRVAMDAPAWLRPVLARAYVEAVAADEVAEPLRWDQAVLSEPLRRSVRLGVLRNMSCLAAEVGVAWVHPFLDPGFLSALAEAGGHFGFPSRTDAMRAIFGGLLPDALLCRSEKATFNRVAFGRYSRAFAERSDGSGLDSDLVDPEALRSTWLSEVPDGRSFLLLQTAWVAAAARAAA